MNVTWIWVGRWRTTNGKEKCGILRTSSAGGDVHTKALEDFALLISARTCQRCGAPGEARKLGDGVPMWHATLCDLCWVTTHITDHDAAGDRVSRLLAGKGRMDTSVVARPTKIVPIHRFASAISA